ncbi:MAG: NAD(P)-dependent oxidoreductase [Gammaproteobacteria bacterium]
MNIAFLGTGLMGTGFVRRMLANGHQVRVWNRSHDKARALQAHGAKAFAQPADAVRGADRIHLSLSDDASVDAVLDPLADAIPAATWIVDHTTTAVTPTAERCARWAARGRVFLHAPVFMAPVHAHEGSGLMLLSGNKGRCDAIAPALEQMSGKVWWLGEAPERASAFKLFGNLVLVGMNGVLGDMMRLAHAVGIPPAEAIGLFEGFNPGTMLKARAAKVASGPWTPASFEVSMSRKDVRLMIEEAAAHGVDLAVMPAVAALLDAAIARGAGAMDASAAMAYPPPAP